MIQRLESSDVVVGNGKYQGFLNMIESYGEAVSSGVVRPLAEPVTSESIVRIERYAKFPCPRDYAAFLDVCNGCRPADGVFAIGISADRLQQQYDEDEDIVIDELFSCETENSTDIMNNQSSYRLRDWVPNQFVTIGWTPGLQHLLLDFETGNVFSWSIPGDVRSKYGDIEWTYWSEQVAVTFSDCWRKLRVIPDPST